MLRLNKRLEYALILLRELYDSGRGEAVSAGALALKSGVAPSLTAKLLQDLSRAAIVASALGASGGYRVVRGPDEVSVLDVSDAVLGPLGPDGCDREYGGLCVPDASCGLESPQHRLGHRVLLMYKTLTLAELFEGSAVTEMI